ncbi:tyrosine-type recombinase/integrase [Paenibacillus sp. KN14-4R]|uniref:tyrosine-type recombinase/integrase n=1 Tax=Paenibacillus sp. KN14-4R TaxID=3445773 RepID=UPI003FA1396D
MDAIETLLKTFADATVHVAPGLFDECYLFQNQSFSNLDSMASYVHDYVWNDNAKKTMKDELQLRGYSMKTIKAYCSQVERFHSFAKMNKDIDLEQLISKHALQMLEHNRSHSYVNQAISAIKFYVKQVLHVETRVSYIRPKKESKLPHVLSLTEVMCILKALHNLKHRTILYLTYSSGLRVSEVVRLKLQDFDYERKTLRIRQGKGRKDRLTLLSDTAMALMKQYIQKERPDIWVFPGQYPTSHITERSVQKIFEQARIASGIQKKVSIHVLRHSFATHLLEGGIDIRFIQDLLDHASVRTTERYTHVSVKDIRRIKSPLDQMDM